LPGPGGGLANVRQAEVPSKSDLRSRLRLVCASTFGRHPVIRVSAALSGTLVLSGFMSYGSFRTHVGRSGDMCDSVSGDGCDTTEIAAACPAAENTLATPWQRVSAAGRWFVRESLRSVGPVVTPRFRVTRAGTTHHSEETM
jgi:hypothetical protein